MGLLDDLKSQQEQKDKPASTQPAALGAEEFYREHVRQRMLRAKDFFLQLANQLNEMNLVIQAPYPLLPEGKKVVLLQQGYRSYSDDVPNPRHITFKFVCVLPEATTYDVRGRVQALTQGELLERYQFKHIKLDARDQTQTVVGARFKLEGPLPVQCVVQFDEAKLFIKILLTNFIGPGTSQYNLKAEQLDEAFLDHLGKYLLRKEAKLFQEEVSNDAKAQLRKKMEQEQLQREEELRIAEEQLKAEELARKQNSTKEQLKKAVSQTVTENKEKLKKALDEQVKDKGEKLMNMFSKLKTRAGFNSASEQSAAAPAENISQPAPPTSKPGDQRLPPANWQAGQTPSAQQTATRPKPVAEQKKPTPPKVFQSSTSNPFLKPQDFEPVTKADDEQTDVNADTENPATPLSAQTPTPAMAKPTPAMSPTATQAKPVAAPNATVATTTNATMPPKPSAESKLSLEPMAIESKSSSPAASTELTLSLEPMAPNTQSSSPTTPTEPKPTTAPSLAQTSIPATPKIPTPTMSPAAVQAKPVATPNASVATTANATMPPKPVAESKLSLEPMASDAKAPSPTTPTEPKMTTVPSPAQSATSAPVKTPTPTMSPAAAQAKPVATPNASVATTANSSIQTKAAAVQAETKKPMAPPSAQTTTPATPSPAAQAKPVATPKASVATTTNASTPPKPSAEPKSSKPSALSMEDELERDLVRIMESDQSKPSLVDETAAELASLSGELDFDLSSPDALEIHFEDTAKSSDQKNSEPKK